MSASDFAALRAWLDFDEQNLPHGDSLRDISYGGAPISRANLRAALDDYETELEAAYRKGWTDCGIHARRETDSLLDEMARNFTETGRAKREFMRRQIAADRGGAAVGVAVNGDLNALRQRLDDAQAALESAKRSAQAARGDQLPDFATQIVVDQIYDASNAVSIAAAATQHGRTEK